MEQYNYNENEIPKMLFTELVLAHVISNNSKFYDEIVRRLKFCGFEDKMIIELISYELELLKVTNKTFNNLLVNTKWWLNDTEHFKNNLLLAPPLERYLLYYEGEMSEKALTSSEIVGIYDEANFILVNKLDLPSSIIYECQTLSNSSSKENLKDEFIHRIDYIYERELNVKYNDDIFRKAMRFFINESHIMFINKYNYKVEKNLKWLPYTDDFFDHFEY